MSCTCRIVGFKQENALFAPAVGRSHVLQPFFVLGPGPFVPFGKKVGAGLALDCRLDRSLI